MRAVRAAVVGITLKGENFKVLAIRLSRKCFMVGCFDINGKEYDITIRAVNQDQSVEEVMRMENIAGHYETYLRDHTGVGIAVPGPVILSEERIALVTGKVGWKNIRFRERFQQRFGIPVYIEHDANAGALAEWWFGHNRMERGTHMYVAAGQGIGAGITLDGKVMHGSMGVAGEIGHMSINCNGPRCQCGNRGCLELYASVSAMVKRINDGIDQGGITSLRRDSTVHQIARAMEMGDPLAVQAFDETAEFLGFGLSQMINLYNPDVIVIGDEFTLWRRQIIRKHCIRFRSCR
ncbi:MAG: ROK family protein [Eisenbergiella sp.]